MRALQLVRPQLMTIGQIARSTKLTPRAIRYYEAAGLVRKMPRTAGNYRLYDGEVLEQLRFIAHCRSLGVSLKEIGALCAILSHGTQTCSRIETLVREHLSLIDSKIRELIKIKSELADKLSQCTGKDAPRCEFVELLRKQQNSRTAEGHDANTGSESSRRRPASEMTIWPPPDHQSR